MALFNIVAAIGNSAVNPCPSWVLQGAAIRIGNEIQLCPDMVQGVAGAAWDPDCVDLTQDFELQYSLYLGNRGAAVDSGNGIGLVLQNDPLGTAAILAGGYGEGSRGIINSVLIEVDTYTNSNLNEPPYNHIKVVENSDWSSGTFAAGPVPALPSQANVVDGAEHLYRVQWTASTQTMDVYLDGYYRLSYTRDLASLLGASCVWYGFTSSNGAAYNTQYFINHTCPSTPLPTPTITPVLTPTATPTMLSTPVCIPCGNYAYNAQWGGGFNWPTHITVDNLGFAYFTDTNNGKAQKWNTATNSIVAGFPLATGGAVPSSRGITFNPVNNRLYVTSTNIQVNVYDTSGNLQGSWGGNGAGNGKFKTVQGLAVDGLGNVYATDWTTGLVQKFTSAGVWILQWGSTGSGTSQFSDALNGQTRGMGIGVDAVSGKVYVADGGNNRVQYFDSSGNYLGQWGTAGSGPGQFNTPLDVAVDGCGNVYVSDWNNFRVQKFDASGNIITEFGTGGGGNGQFTVPYGVAVDNAGRVYVVDSGGNQRVQVFVCGAPANTPTATPSATLSPHFTSGGTTTASPSPTPTATITDSSTATPSFTGTPSPSPVFSPTYTGTATPSLTSSPSPSGTPSSTTTPTQRPSPSRTLTFSASPTVSPTPTISATYTPPPALRAAVKVFNISGELVAVIAQGLPLYGGPMGLKTLDPAFLPDLGQSGRLEITGPGVVVAWNGVNAAGQPANSGAYKVQLSVMDAFGRLESFTAAIQVLRGGHDLRLEIFSASGELVRGEFTASSSAALDGLALDKESFVAGDAQNGVRIIWGKGPGDSWIWDGTNEAGRQAGSGSYMVQVSARTANGESRLYSRTVTLLEKGAAGTPGLALAPNPVRPGDAFIHVGLPGFATGAKATARMYGLTGEQAAFAESGTNTLEVPANDLAGGIYVVAVEIQIPGKAPVKTFRKIAVLR